MDLQVLYQDWRRDGTRRTLHGLAMRVIKRLAPYQAMYGVHLALDQLTVAESDVAYETRFLEAHELLRFTEQEPALEPDFTRDAIARGDRCYGVLDGDRLASFGWYSTRATVVLDHLYLHFDPAFCYMYNGFTHPDYRGERLHGIGMARALRALTDEGCRGIVAVVDTDNVRSLRSCSRLGYRRFGVIRIMGRGEGAWIHASSGCAAYDVTLSPSAERDPVTKRRRSPKAA